MPTSQTPQLSLNELILRFRSDCELTHDFVRGDASLDIVGTDGTYPSLAKIMANIEIAIAMAKAANIGFVAKSYTFAPSMSWNIKHPEIPTTNFSFTITNTAGQEVFAPKTIVDNTEFNIDFTDFEGGVLNVIYYVVP